MTKRADYEPGNIDVPPESFYLAQILKANPALTDEDEGALSLASLYRMRAYHRARLERDPGDSYSTDLMIKLTTIILRQQSELGVETPRAPAPNPKDETKPTDGPRPIQVRQ